MTNILDLPIDSLSDVFYFVPWKEIATRLPRVCKYFYKVANHQPLWKRFYVSEWQNLLRVSVEDYRRLYIEAVLSNEWFLKGECSQIRCIGHTAGPQAVQFQNEKEIIFTAGRDCSIRKWSTLEGPSPSQGVCLKVVEKAHSDFISFLQFDSSELYTVGDDRKVHVWDVNTLEKLKSVDLERFFPKFSRINAFQMDNDFLVFSLIKFKESNASNNNIPKALHQPNTFYQSNTLIAVPAFAVGEGKIIVLNRKDQTLRYEIQNCPATAFQFDSQYLIAGGNLFLKRFNFRNGDFLMEYDLEDVVRESNYSKPFVRNLQFNSNYIICNFQDYGLDVFDLLTGYFMACLFPQHIHHARIRAFQFDPTKIVCGLEDGSIAIISLLNPSIWTNLRIKGNIQWDRFTSPKTFIITIGSHTDAIYALHYYGAKIVTVSGDKRVYLWDFNPSSLPWSRTKKTYPTSLLPTETTENQKNQKNQTENQKNQKSFFSRFFSKN